MSDIELVISNSKKLESLLEKHLGATGKGLHEKVSSVERKLPDGVVRKLRFVATIRNKIVHDEGYDRIDDRKAFVDACAFTNAELRKLAGLGSGSGITRWVASAVIVLVIAIVLYFMFFRD
jgi:hypothetical protein